MNVLIINMVSGYIVLNKVNSERLTNTAFKNIESAIRWVGDNYPNSNIDFDHCRKGVC